VYTKDTEKANRIASLIDAGQVGINCYPLENMGVQCPWCVFICCLFLHIFIPADFILLKKISGLFSFAFNVNIIRVGHKHSGFGYHSGVDGCLQFSIPKTIVSS